MDGDSEKHSHHRHRHRHRHRHLCLHREEEKRWCRRHSQSQDQRQENQQMEKKYMIEPIRIPNDLVTVKELFTSYAVALGIDLTFQNFERELGGLPGAYGRPGGEILIAWEVHPLPSSSCSCVENGGGNERGGQVNELNEGDGEAGAINLNHCSGCGEFGGGEDGNGENLNSGSRTGDSRGGRENAGGDGVVDDDLEEIEKWKRSGRAVAVGCVALRPLHSASRTSAPTTATAVSNTVSDITASTPTAVPTPSSTPSPSASSHPFEDEPQPTKTAELKRLYVDPAHRSSGVGRLLMSEIIKVAQQRGYDEIKLDTIPSMIAAQKMYERMGFRDVEGYCYNPIPGVRFMSLDLRMS